MSQIAIDFGTARTKVARFDPDANCSKMINLGREVSWAIPSLFYIPKDGELLIGDDAQEAFRGDPAGVVRGLKVELHRVAPIRRNGRRFERTDLVARLFGWIRGECDRQVFHDDPVTDCVLTVPPGFGAFEIDRLTAAAENGGFKTVTTVEEPVSAAKSWLSTSQTKTRHVAVCDIGGGTTDLALVEADGGSYTIVPEIRPQTIPVGGNAIDRFAFETLDIDHIPETAYPGLLVRIRQAKERVTHLNRAVSIKIADCSLSIAPEAIRDASEKFTEMIARHIQRLRSKIDRSGKLNADEIPLLLVGGGRYIIGLKETLSTIWPHVYVWEDSERATVLGALISGAPPPHPPTPANGQVKRYQEYVESITMPSIHDDIDKKASFTDELEILINERKSLDELVTQDFERIEAACWAKTAEHLLAVFKLEIANAKNQAQALAHLSQALKLWKKPESSGSNDEVIRECNVALGFDAECFPAMYLKAKALFKELKHAQVIDMLNGIIEQKGPSRTVLYHLGISQLLTRDRRIEALSIDSFNKALSCDVDPELNDIDPEPYPSDTRLIVYRSYAQFISDQKTACIDGLSTVTSVEPNAGGKVDVYSVALLLAIQLNGGPKDTHRKWYLTIYRKLFSFRQHFGDAVGTIENHIDHFPKWKSIFDGIGRSAQFEDRVKKWLYSDLKKFYPGDQRRQIAEYVDITTVTATTDPWALSDESVIDREFEPLVALISVYAERGHSELARQYLKWLWVLYKKTHLATVIKNPFIKPVFKHASLRLNIPTHIDIGVFFNDFNVTNKSVYPIHNVKIQFYVSRENKISKVQAPTIDRIMPDETVDLSSLLPNGLRRWRDKVYNVSLKCAETDLLP